MKYIKIFIVAFSLFTLTAYGQENTEEKFPKTGYVKNDGSVVKAGDNINFESLCILPKSKSVKVIGRRYSWLQIILPRQAALYINKDYVTLTSDEKGVGIVNAANVNLRAGPGTRYSIIGQISKPEKVSILSEDAGWYKIEPPYGSTGWISSSQIDMAKEENEIKNTEQKEETKEVKKEKIKPSTVRLNVNYPVPKVKGNLSVH